MEFRNALYEEDIRRVAGAGIPWDRLIGRSVLIAGATGMLGRAMTDLLMYKNEKDNLDCHIYAAGRSRHKAERRFGREYFGSPCFTFLEWDVTDKAPASLPKVDFVLGMASNTHPLAYAARPIETILTNIYGTKNLLDVCRQQGGRNVFLSSVEIYGENRGDKTLFDEKYMGFLDCNTLRAGYPESKRCGESLCQAYLQEEGVESVIVRLPRLFGPTLLEEDSKAVSQFIHKALLREDIVLKSSGSQHYSFLYVMDAVTGILTVMLSGKAGVAYNLASEDNDATLKSMAETVAGAVGKKVIYELPDEDEKAGYSIATVARLDGGKAMKLGWKPMYHVADALERTIRIMQVQASVREKELPE